MDTPDRETAALDRLAQQPRETFADGSVFPDDVLAILRRRSVTRCPGRHAAGDVWCAVCGHGLPLALEDGPGRCPCCGVLLPDRRGEAGRDA